MKNKLTGFAATVVSLLLIACGQDPHVSNSTPDHAVQNVSVSKNDVQQKKAGNTAFNLLQGKWQSTGDRTNYLLFEKNHRKEIAGGMDKWDDEVFTLSDHCINNSDISGDFQKEKDSYISCPQSDLCWYVVTLDSLNLSLSYMSRGNTLTYKKVR